MSAIAPRIAVTSIGSRITLLSHTNTVSRSLSSVISCRLPSPSERVGRPLSPIAIHSRLALHRTRDFPIHAATPASFYSSSSLSPSPASENKKEFAKLTRLEDANPERIPGIEVNPDSTGYGVLPGNLIYKTYNWSGNTRKVPLELAHGYFWMIKDLKQTDQKPTLSNETLIPQNEARVFPTLEGLTTLDDLHTSVDLPLFFLEHAHGLQQNKKPSKQKSGGGKVTLVAITFRDNGFKMMPTWTEPFEKAFGNSSSSSNLVQTFSVSITERWALYPIKNTIKRVMRNNTPTDKHSSTLAYFGTKEVMEFRDVLRMHNIMTGYVFLLDDLGRVRFAGSGEASAEEVARLVGFAKDLVKESEGGSSATTRRTSNKASSKKRR
jgi:ATPase complex subunit ATP10